MLKKKRIADVVDAHRFRPHGLKTQALGLRFLKRAPVLGGGQADDVDGHRHG
jgi:hypothetical protein